MVAALGRGHPLLGDMRYARLVSLRTHRNARLTRVLPSPHGSAQLNTTQACDVIKQLKHIHWDDDTPSEDDSTID